MGNFYFLFFKKFLLLLTKLSVEQDDWGLGYHSMRFRQLSNFLNFLRASVLRRSAAREETRIYHVSK